MRMLVVSGAAVLCAVLLAAPGLSGAEERAAQAARQEEETQLRTTATGTAHTFAEAGGGQQDPGTRELFPAIAAHKINYFTLNRFNGSDSQEIKFQVSVKFALLRYDAMVPGTRGGVNLFFAYTQKSLWDWGKPSAPFEESNYNPEFFLEYKPDLAWGDLSLRSVRLSPYEHESNGMDGASSRSWNRRYVMFRLGYLPLPKTTDLLAPQDRIELNVRVWHPWAYYEQDDYLRSVGNTSGFIRYAGLGEVNLVWRPLTGVYGNQLDVTTRFGQRGHRETWLFEFQQKVPLTRFALYGQYFYGYNESLLRFDRKERNRYFGISFSF